MTAGYAAQNDIVLIADKRITSIPITDNHEEMINLTQQKEIAYGPSPEMAGNKDYTMVRKSVYEKLKKAQSLLPKEVKLSVYEGYRSIDTQEKLFHLYYEKIKAEHPKLSDDEIFAETSKLIVPIKNQDGSPNIPPEATGGAVSVYLIDKNGLPVDMGFSPKDWLNDPSGKLSRTFSDSITIEAQHYRDIMSDAMRTAGFVNYPPLYWHWSYGDQYWAYQTNQPNAIYGVWDPKNIEKSTGDVKN